MRGKFRNVLSAFGHYSEIPKVVYFVKEKDLFSSQFERVKDRGLSSGECG